MILIKKKIRFNEKNSKALSCEIPSNGAIYLKFPNKYKTKIKMEFRFSVAN